ncbi:MAG: ANTAR domain-containing protein, partial [Thauera sp.]|nr:ANTAR domain-containing protein [Thauera sp.]
DPLAPLGVALAAEAANDDSAFVEPGAASAAAPLGPRLTRSIVDVLQVQSRRLQVMSDELAAARAALDERKLVERAKGVLMRHQGLAEDEAHRLLRQTAMNQGRRIAEVAQAVLAMESFLPARG